jgi:hypothetical protein
MPTTFSVPSTKTSSMGTIWMILLALPALNLTISFLNASSIPFCALPTYAKCTINSPLAFPARLRRNCPTCPLSEASLTASRVMDRQRRLVAVTPSGRETCIEKARVVQPGKVAAHGSASLMKFADDENRAVRLHDGGKDRAFCTRAGQDHKTIN